jgi:cell division protein FtsN
VDVSAGRFWRVRMGPLASIEDAEDLLGRVRDIGHHDARIVVSSN